MIQAEAVILVATERVWMTQESDAARITRAIFEHAARISQEQEIARLIQLNADFARDLAGADRCSLWLIDEPAQELWTKVAHGVDTIRIPVAQGLVGACIAEDRVLLVNDAAHEQRLLRSVDEHSGYRTQQVLCVPMRAQGRVIGALQLLNKCGGFTEEDTGLLGLLAHFAASAIESERLRQEAARARLLHFEIELARDVQTKLLPASCPALPGLASAGFCRPARSVGGDYYDFLPLRSGDFAFTLGDVSGKGIASAVMMASIQTLLRSMLERESAHLPELIGDLNRALYASSTPERYSTLFCGLVSADRRRLTYLNAGQVPPYLLHADGALEQLNNSNLPVGLLPGVAYEQQTVPLREGDLLVVVSDGMMEVRNLDGEFWDEAGVGALIQQHGAQDASELAGNLCRSADAWANGADQYDDMTVIAVRILQAVELL